MHNMAYYLIMYMMVASSVGHKITISSYVGFRTRTHFKMGHVHFVQQLWRMPCAIPLILFWLFMSQIWALLTRKGLSCYQWVLVEETKPLPLTH